MKEFKRKLFSNYDSTHVAFLDPDNNTKQQWFQNYVQSNYADFLKDLDRGSCNILEIGCNKGFLLVALKKMGFKNLTGVDISSEDICAAQERATECRFLCQDAFDFLNENKAQFDLIVLKAVLEHIDKDEILPFLEKIKQGLKIGGQILVDVPNMDWLFASHERYMDFTHEIGFTQDSLRQVMNQVFDAVVVRPIDNIQTGSSLSRIKLKIIRFFINACLRAADPEGGFNPIWCRSLVGIGKNSAR